MNQKNKYNLPPSCKSKYYGGLKSGFKCFEILKDGKMDHFEIK